MPRPRRLSPLDRVFLDLDTAETPQQVGWVIRFEGKPPTLAEFREHIGSRLGQLPRFRMRIGRSKRRLGGPEWTPATTFSIADHVLGARAQSPGDAAALTAVAGQLLSRRLDRNRPLWRLYLVDGLANGWAVVGHGHHALIDGLAAVEVAMRLLDPIQGTQAPTQAPTKRRRRRRRRVRNLVRGARMMALRGPVIALDEAGDGTRGIGMGSVDQRMVRLAARRYGATSNDLLLGAVSRALSEELKGHGEAPAWIKVLMPFQLRTHKRGREAGNEISAVTIELPLGHAKTDDLLAEIVSSTKAGKALGNAGVMGMLARVAGFIPGLARPLVTRAIYRFFRFNLVVSNLRGPSTGFALMGRAATSFHPFVPLTQGQGIAIGVMSYSGRFWIGVNANAALVDAGVFTERVEQGFAELAAQAAVSA